MLGKFSTCLNKRFNPINHEFYSLHGSDDDYVQNSNDQLIVKRICYRSLLTHYSNLYRLDGLEISLENRKSSSRHVTKFKKAMYCVTTLSENLFQDWNSECKPLLFENPNDFFIIIPDQI